MSVTATKTRLNFQHLNVLRKTLIAKRTGTLNYTMKSGNSGYITITMGDIIGGQDAIQQLTNFLSEPSTHCDWDSGNLNTDSGRVKFSMALGQAIHAIRWDNSVSQALKNIFSKLPSVYVRMAPLHHFEHTDGLTYLLLHQQSLSKKGFSPIDFLHDATDGIMLQRRLKALVLGYCLGLITTIPKTLPEAIDKKGRASMASRIMRRIRGF